MPPNVLPLPVATQFFPELPDPGAAYSYLRWPDKKHKDDPRHLRAGTGLIVDLEKPSRLGRQTGELGNPHETLPSCSVNQHLLAAKSFQFSALFKVFKKWVQLVPLHRSTPGGNHIMVRTSI